MMDRRKFIRTITAVGASASFLRLPKQGKDEQEDEVAEPMGHALRVNVYGETYYVLLFGA